MKSFGELHRLHQLFGDVEGVESAELLLPKQLRGKHVHNIVACGEMKRLKGKRLKLLRVSSAPVIPVLPSRHRRAMVNEKERRANLSGLVDSFLWIRLDFVAGVVRDFGNGLLEYGRRLSHWQRCVQVGFALKDTWMWSIRMESVTKHIN